MLEAITQPIKNMVQNVFGGKQEGPEYDDDLVAYVDREFQRRQQERRPFELQWRLNLAFYEGNQYLDINTASMALEEMPILYDWNEREVFNHIAPNIDSRVSRLKRVRSVLKVRPGNADDPSDMHSAKVETQILKNNYTDQRIQDRQSEEFIWLETCGTVFRKHVWNPQLGKVIGVVPTTDESGQETGQQEEVREGDGETIVVPPQECYPDSCYRNNLEECKSFIHAKAFSVDDIMDTWGIEVRPEEAESEKLQATMNGFGGLGYGQGGFNLTAIKLENHAIVKEYWEVPSKKYPQGRLIITAGGKLLHAGHCPYMVGENGTEGIPFAMLICLKRPGIFWGKTVLERLIPVQRRYNALRNRKAEYLNRCAIGQYWAEEESIDTEDMEQNAGMPGYIGVVRKGARYPQPVENPTLPASFDAEEATLLNEFSILSGVSEVSRQSAAPPGVKSGVALSIIQEQDDTRLSNTVENVERFNIQSGKIQLRLAKQFVKAPRTLYAVGRNNVAEVMDYIGSDIKGENVVLDNMSALAESIAQKRQMVFDLLQAGLMVDPETGRMDKTLRSRALEMIELGEWESADDVESLHMAKAERENKALSQGQLPQAVNYDEHIIHVDAHNKFRLTVDYEELAANLPMVEQIFEAHVNMHLMFLQQQAAAQMAMAEQQQQDRGDENAA